MEQWLGVKTSDEVKMRKRENTIINLQLEKILHELSENAQINKKREKFNNRQENNQNLLLQVCDLSYKVKKADAIKAVIWGNLVSAEIQQNNSGTTWFLNCMHCHKWDVAEYSPFTRASSHNIANFI